MQLVYPKSKPKAPYVIFESATFVIGSIAPGNRLKVHGEEVAVSKHGYFAHKVALRDGGNVIRCQELAPDGWILAEAQALVEVVPPLEALPYDPLRAHPETLVPKSDIALLPGDAFVVKGSLSAGCDAGVRVPGVMDSPVALSALKMEKAEANAGAGSENYIDNKTRVFQQWHQTSSRIAKKGYYEGAIKVPDHAKPVEQKPIDIVLRNDYGERVIPCHGTLSVWDKPRWVQVNTDRAITRNGAGDHADRMTPQRAGAVLAVDRLENGWFRMAGGASEAPAFWVYSADAVQVAEGHGPHAVSAVWGCRVSEYMATLGLTLAEPGRHPAIQIQTTRNQLTLMLPGTTTALKTLSLDSACGDVIGKTTLGTSEESFSLMLEVPRLCGYDYRYTETGVELLIRTLPKTPEEISVVIDPGHGGDEHGATGPDGLFEKDLNLTVATQLSEALKKHGFKVTQTRTKDETLGLEERVAFVRTHRADIVLSIHHNALPDGRDPMTEQGSSSFYYHAFSKPLAEAMQQALVGSVKTNNYGVFEESFVMTRIHEAMASLVEIGFFTYPDEFERLITPAFQRRATQAMAQVLSDFIQRGG